MVAALGAIEGAIGDIDEGVIDGDIDATVGTEIMDALAGISRVFADDAIVLAENIPSSNKKALDTARELLAAGDVLRADGFYKDATASYKDALTEAQSALR